MNFPEPSRFDLPETSLDKDVSNALSLPIQGGSDERMDDARALMEWLAFVESRNKETFRSYRSEALRFRLFLETVHADSANRPEPFLLRDASETDVANYEAALLGSYRNKDKSPPVVVVPRHLMLKYRRTKQPFVIDAQAEALIQVRPIGLKASSVNQAITILHALYEHWLVPDAQTKESYVRANPVRRVKGSTNRVQRQTARNFPPEAITAIMETLSMQKRNADPDKEASAILRLARRRWIVALFFGLWGRRQELAQLRMCDFQHNGSRWTVHLKRKGGKVQDLPVAPWVVHELTEYRGALGLSPLPRPDDETPAIPRLKGRSDMGDGPMNADTLYREITTVAQDAARALRAEQVLPETDALQRELLASRLDGVTPHWFRHSGASIAINSGAMTLNNASKMLGHSSPTITAEMYHHPDDSQIEEGMQQLGAKAFGK